ncbi:hypothetical protein [Peribacillus butanolivorans]
MKIIKTKKKDGKKSEERFEFHLPPRFITAIFTGLTALLIAIAMHFL